MGGRKKGAKAGVADGDRARDAAGGPLPGASVAPPRPLDALPAASGSATGPLSPPPEGVWIGVAGAPESTVGGGSHRAVARCRELGIDALEMAWVHTVTISEGGAARIRRAAEEAGVRLSVHAPYYVNLNSADPGIVEASIRRIAAAARGAGWCGARDVVLHLAYNHADAPPVVLRRVAEGLVRARDALAGEASEVRLRPEVMGRASQFGDLDEILRLCADLPGTAPCIDIAHLHARTGAYNSAAEFDALWDAVADALGPGALQDVHVHISGIAYGPLGEREHLKLDDADLDYRTFLAVMHARAVRGLVVVESPGREGDVAVLQAAWREIVGGADAIARSGLVLPGASAQMHLVGKTAVTKGGGRQ